MSGEALEKKQNARDEVNERLKKQALETGWSVARLVGQLEPRVKQTKKKSLMENRKKGSGGHACQEGWIEGRSQGWSEIWSRKYDCS